MYGSTCLLTSAHGEPRQWLLALLLSIVAATEGCFGKVAMDTSKSLRVPTAAQLGAEQEPFGAFLEPGQL